MMRLLFSCLLTIMLVLPAWAVNEVKVGEKAPDFTLSTLGGEKMSLSSYKGKIVVIGFVDTCEPCKIQAQELEKLRIEYQKNPKVVILGVVFEDKRGTTKLLRATDPKPQYPLLLDPKMSTFKSYGLKGEPVVVIVDSGGNVSFKNYIIRAAELSKEVNKLLR